MIAQEVDPAFIKALRDPSSSREAKSAPHHVMGQETPTVVGSGQGRNYNERPANLKPWHVAEADEGPGSEASTLIVAARSSLALSSTMVEWHKLFHCQYKKKGKLAMAYSRVLCAQINWRKPMHGQTSVQFLNVHFHNLPAKKVQIESANVSGDRKHHGEYFLWTPSYRETLHHGVVVGTKTSW